MTTRRDQNSFLVIATLGVYLGLVLAGATPQVLASAALTKAFDVRDEIDVSDDLDNKPDDERSPVTASVQIYLEDVEYFLVSLSRLAAQGKFDPRKDTFSILQRSMLPCVANNIAGRYTPVRFDTSSEAARSPLTYFSRGMVYGYSLGDCVANFELKEVESVDSRFDIKLDDKGFTVNLAVRKQSPRNAVELLNSLKSTLNIYSNAQATKFRKRIIEQTRFRTEKDQVLVRLHLARSDLDSLLATDAK